MNIKKIIAYACVAIIYVSAFHPVYAETAIENAPYKLPINSEEKKLEKTSDSSENVKVKVEAEKEADEEKTLNLTVESAVEYGLEHNKSIEMLENKIELALVASQNANKNSKDLKNAEELLENASNELFDKKKQLEKAKDMLKREIAPIEIENPGGIPVVITAGDNIRDTLSKSGIPDDKIDGIVSSIVLNVEKELNYSQEGIKQAETILELNQEEFKAVLSDTSDKLNTKINYGSIINLDADDASELMIKMAGVNLDVTRYAKNIYRNQIAMLIQKNYYDALQAEKIFTLQKVAMERGEKQFNMVKLSYENGMKAKDDFLLGKMYYDSTIISCRLAEANYKNALFELKENLNLEMNTQITLNDSMVKEVTEEDLEKGLKSGLTNRIEIQKMLGQLMIYELNEDILKSRPEYRNNTKGIREAKLLREGAEIDLDKTKTTVKSEINQSYETMVATGDMLLSANELINNAEEVVRIANLKYEQGFGAENSLLKQLNLQDSSGTIIELITAQEKLSEVEAQVAQIKYSYTMAKIKYSNDSAILIH